MMIEFEDHNDEGRKALLAYLAGERALSRRTWRDWLAIAGSSAFLALMLITARYCFAK